jgi:hypothetical protein
MIRPPAMTSDEAAQILSAMVSRWPHPELDDAGLSLELHGILDSGLTRDEAMTAIRLLLQTRTRFRPDAADLRDAIRPHRRPEWPALPAPTLTVAEQKARLADTRAQLRARLADRPNPTSGDTPEIITPNETHDLARRAGAA